MKVLETMVRAAGWIDRRRWVKGSVMGAGAVIWTLILISPWYGLGYRIDESWPHDGLFVLEYGVPVQRGDLVMFAMDDTFVGTVQPAGLPRPYARAGRLWMKRLAGVPGDPIVVDGDKVYVNRQLVGTIRSTDSSGRPLQAAALPSEIPPGFAYVALDHPLSFDSRYFGLIPVELLLGKVWPLV